MFSRILLMLVSIGTLLSSCNDLPTDTGTELVPGTDTMYAESSLGDTIMTGAATLSQRVPSYNGTYVLFGKTNDSEARMFYELVEYPKLGASTDWEITSSELVMLPQAYMYGDTNSKTLALTAYELKQAWASNVTWDSVWAADGSTSYYSTADQPVCTFNKDLTATDTVVYVPFSTEATKRWITLGSDSATRDQVFGMVFLPTAGASIRQYRNLNGNTQVMQFRIGVKHKDSTDIDTMMLDAVAATLVNTPDASSGELLLQGARIHNTTFTIDISKLDSYAILLGGKLSLRVDTVNSQIGNLGYDELVDLIYSPASGGRDIGITTRIDATKQYFWINVVPILQQIRKDGGRGTIRIQPTDVNRLWRMNRLKFYGADAATDVRPRLTILYARPTVFQ